MQDVFSEKYGNYPTPIFVRAQWQERASFGVLLATPLQNFGKGDGFLQWTFFPPAACEKSRTVRFEYILIIYYLKNASSQ